MFEYEGNLLGIPFDFDAKDLECLAEGCYTIKLCVTEGCIKWELVDSNGDNPFPVQ